MSGVCVVEKVVILRLILQLGSDQIDNWTRIQIRRCCLTTWFCPRMPRMILKWNFLVHRNMCPHQNRGVPFEKSAYARLSDARLWGERACAIHVVNHDRKRRWLKRHQLFVSSLDTWGLGNLIYDTRTSMIIPFSQSRGGFLHLTRLSLGNQFNHPLGELPLGLKRVTLGNQFNQPLDLLPLGQTHQLPLGLTHLTLGHNFNQTLDSLPPSLTHLSLNVRFNQRLDHLPPRLCQLTFHYHSCFNHRLDRLPSSLTHLKLGCHFQQPLEALPVSLRHLEVNGEKYDQPLEHLPASLESFRMFDGGDLHHTLEHLPSMLRHLTLKLVDTETTKKLHEPHVLPPTLEVLELDFLWGFVCLFPGICLEYLTRLRQLKIKSSFYPVTRAGFPSSLKRLHFIWRQEAKYFQLLPPQLTHLTLDGPLTFTLNNLLPISLRHLCLKNYQHPLSVWPPELVTLNVGHHFDHPLNYGLPSSLQTLKVGLSFMHSFSRLPIHLRHLVVTQKYPQEWLDALTPSSDLHIEREFAYCLTLLN